MSTNQLPEDRFLFGASTAPYAKSMDWPESEYERDFENMKRLNFNTIRIFAAWDRIEVGDGVFDFSKIDSVIARAASHGLGVIVNFGGVFGSLCGIYPPQFLRNYDCNPVQPHPGVPQVNATPVMNICPDHPTYRLRAFRFMETLIRRYAETDAVIAWMIWNEPASPFCYCPHTLARFRNWLRDKYRGDIAELNRRWSTEFPLAYREWAEVLAPSGKTVGNMWRDWTEFNQARLSENMREIDRLVDCCDPRRRPTTANLVYHMAAMEGPAESALYGLDIGGVGQAMSIMGVSCYTVEHKYDPAPGWKTSYKLSRLRSASRDEHRRMLVLETGAGPNRKMITPAWRILMFWQLIAHNVKSILLWNYRSRLSDGQVALFHLMNFDGTVSDRARYMGEFAGMLQTEAKLLNTVYPERRAAVLAPEFEQLGMNTVTGEHPPMTYESCHNSRYGAFKLLFDLKIPADCPTEFQYGELDRYSLLLLPMAEYMTPELAAALEQYVRNGGTLIAEGLPALRDNDGLLQYRVPGFGLDRVFGAFTRDREVRETAPKIQTEFGESCANLFWSRLELAGAETLATWADNGSAAVTRHRYGKGIAILAGTEVFRQYAENEQGPMTALLTQAVLDSGAEPVARVVSGDARNVEFVRLAGPGGAVRMYLNYDAEPRRFVTDAPGGRELGTGRRVTAGEKIELAAHGALAWKEEA